MHIVVVGAGIMGLATAWQLVKRGHRVTVLEQGPTIPHRLAASGDRHRMIRRAYGSQTGYASLIDEAFEAWDELWDDLGESAYEARGVLAICQTLGDEADGFREGFDAAGTPYRLFEPAEAQERYPFIDPKTIRYAFLTPEGGVLMCREIAEGLAAWLRAKGTDLRCDAKVVSIDAEAGSVGLSSGETLVADRIVVAAGAWTPALFTPMRDILTVYRTHVVYLDPPQDLQAAWREAPAIVSIGGPTEGYVLPPVREAGLKFGASVVKRHSCDAGFDRIPHEGEGETLRDLFSPPLTRIAEYRVSDVVTCAYAFTDDDRFVSKSFGRVTAVSACSGHGYKFGAAVGRRVARFVDDGDENALLSFLRGSPLRSAA